MKRGPAIDLTSVLDAKCSMLDAQCSMLDANGRWHEVFDSHGMPREPYRELLSRLERFSSADVQELEDRLDATLRELGVAFERPEPGQRNTWFSDLLPHVFVNSEWELIRRGFQQRIRAFEALLADVYGPREILRAGGLPTPLILGSAQFQRSAVGLRPARESYLHLSGLCLCRDPEGRLVVKNHYFSHASGLSYMVQNRRLLARVVPDLFEGHAVDSIAGVPTEILVTLRSLSARPEPLIVLLTPGVTSAVYSEHSFLARRMGIQLVHGGDLVVLNDAVFLKTVAGLERVDVIYSRVADHWVDPLVFKADSSFGIPGLVHCIRKGTVAFVNGIGAQLADDRSLLHFSNAIIRFYLGENPILPTLQTYWLGDLDQREMVMGQLDRFQIRSLTGERYLASNRSQEFAKKVEEEVLAAPHLFVAQPVEDTARTLCFERGKRVERVQDHLVYGIRRGTQFEVFPGALTRLSSVPAGRTESEHGGGGKDTWVLQYEPIQRTLKPMFFRPWALPARRVTSRVADAFYWLGRYLERALNVAKMAQVVETLEMEELTSAERKLYRPVWNELLPPLEQGGQRRRRGMANAKERYRLMLDNDETGSVASIIRIGSANADTLREAISPEAASVLATLRSQLGRVRYRDQPTEAEARRATRKTADLVVGLVPQFVATAQFTMLTDDGWKFAELGIQIERAVSTGIAACSIAGFPSHRQDTRRSIDLEVSAILRLLGCRDAFRRIYQTRSAIAPTLEFLWQNAALPRSVRFCLDQCSSLVAGLGPNNALANEQVALFFTELTRAVLRVDWYSFFSPEDELAEGITATEREKELVQQSTELLEQLQRVHYVVTDWFLSHQGVISDPEPTLF